MKKASIMVFVGKDGKILEAKNVDLSPIKYAKNEKKRIKGARVYTPNGCCWRWTPSGWKCLPC
jgi:hypothetical protein